jgi:hypothetical protein
VIFEGREALLNALATPYYISRHVAHGDYANDADEFDQQALGICVN